MKILKNFTNLFPLVVLTASMVALVFPNAFIWFSGNMITWGLAVIMLGMGITLRPSDFTNVFKTPFPVFIGLLLQYTLMPLLGFILASTFALPPFLAAGLILVSCCPGGTASNVICYLARANVALSVTMTAFSTILAIVFTPLLTSFLIGNTVSVDAFALFSDTIKVVLLPVITGVLINRLLPDFAQKVIPFAPPVAVVFVTLIVASIIGGGKEIILISALSLFTSVILLHAGGFILGYLIARMVLKNEASARTVSIEVGMQNSGLGALLAKNNFPDPATAVPSALSSLTHCILGSLFAFVSKKYPVKKKQTLSLNSEIVQKV
ncbi:MAG: bile acid:sodium symporter family protein [Cytophagaceae bacterium]